MRWVGQEHPDGCGIACLAMLLGLSYERADELVETGERKATHHVTLDKILAEQGRAVARIYQTSPVSRKPRHPWPPLPFADAHLCQVRVRDAGGQHWVVMEATGAVLDPMSSGFRDLADYWEITSVAAVVLVGNGNRLREGGS